MTAHIPEPIDNSALPSDRTTQATPQAPSGLGHPVSVTSADTARFTPGPWFADLHNTRRNGGRFYAAIWKVGDASPIGVISLNTEGMPDAEGRANARLIAAAPDLLDALENLVIGIGMGWDLDGIIEASNAAIAKARGDA